MDNRVNPLHDLFSRGSTPPVQQQPFNNSHRVDNSSPNELDNLFHHISAPHEQQQQIQQQPQVHSVQSSDAYSTSAPVTPSMSLTDEPLSSAASVPNSSSADRQSALLSLLGGAAPVRPAVGSSAPQQVPTPPGSSQRSNASPNHNETQGKILLEQLMSGNPPRSNYSETQRAPQPAAPSPPYVASQRDGDYRFHQHDQPNVNANELSGRSQAIPSVLAPQQQQQQQQQQPQQQPTQQQQQDTPSPRRSMFDFVTPFDHLSSSASVKKKPVPQQPASASSGNEDSGSWTTVTDPKRQSVENLLEHLTRGQSQQHVPPAQVQAPAYESYLTGGDFSQTEPISIRALPAQPQPPKSIPNRTASPRASPPKSQAQRPRPRAVESPAGQQSVTLGHSQSISRREKESSPGPRGGAGARPKDPLKFNNKSQFSPGPQTQSIIFDVTRPLDEIQAPRDSVKSTAIALVRQDSVFLPGTTIGATHWVAYAMTRGRVRVISRSSGDRTLLQLPSIFPSTSTVTDMAVYGNRLAGVTVDGGFVVWELPELITDDVPGLLLLCVPPTSDSDALHSVKWHPKDAQTLAVASQNKLFVIDLANTHALDGQPLPHSDLHHIGQHFAVSSPIIAFDFDVSHYSIAAVSEDSTLTIWNMNDRVPYAIHKISGDDSPSSLTFVDGGLVVGRKNGTVFQLLSLATKSILSEVKFISGIQEDIEMFGHVSYDSRIQTLWVANSRRDSMIAFRINVEPSFIGHEETTKGFFEQIVEFAGPKPTIHFVILTADADPHGDEAHAACVAAKVPPGELALVAFSVHSSGVDQILIRKEWLDNALVFTPSKFPIHAIPHSSIPPVLESKLQPQTTQLLFSGPQSQPRGNNTYAPRSRTPPSDAEGDYNREDGRLPDTKGKGVKGKNVNWKEKDDSKEKAPKTNDAVLINDSSLGQALTREIRKTEENLHTRLGRLIGKEMDKQHQRLEDARAHEQAEDFARQEKILKLISTELTRNTTRVVEMAVKNEVQNSVLPSLENITKNEVKAALNDQIGRGLIDFISQSLPIEMEKLLLRPDISNHFAHILSSNLTPLIERHVKDAVAKTFIPMYSQQSSSMHQELLRELRTEIHSVKTELTAWQSEAFRNHESTIRELELTVRTLSEQVKFLSLNNNNSAASMHHLQQQPQQSHNSPGPAVPQMQGNLNQSHLRPQNIAPPATNQPSSNYSHNHAAFQQTSQPSVMHGPWFAPSIAAPQASHPATIPQPTQTQPHQERTPPVKAEQWDEIYLGVLHSQDASKLRDLLMRTNPDLIMPLNGTSLVSQAVILTLVHRLSAVVGETSPNDETFKTSLWWLQRSAALLRPDDKLIIDFIPRVVPNVQHSLNTTKQRLSILPGGPSTLETVRTLSDIQDVLRRKVSV